MAPTDPSAIHDAAPWDDEPPWVRDESTDAAPPMVSAVPASTVNARDADRSRPRDDDAAVERVPPPAPREPNPLQDRWVGHVYRLIAGAAVTGLVRELAWQAECIAVDASSEPPVWRLCVERESLRQPSHRERLQAALTDLLGVPLRLEVVPGEVSDSAARRDAAAKARAQRSAEDLIQGDPVVQQLLARYPGSRIVPGSIRPR
jgi:DNA polymerase-3 subunit gamma/tau